MGSTGSGSFSDYSRHKPTNKESTNGGASGTDKCDTAFSCMLEEVSRCYYFMNYHSVPPINTDITITFNGVRLAVETFKGEEVGYLPTRYNYIKVCMDNGFRYSGIIKHSAVSPTPNVQIDITPI